LRVHHLRVALIKPELSGNAEKQKAATNVAAFFIFKSQNQTALLKKHYLQNNLLCIYYSPKQFQGG
jgi:hypothetical protein